MAIVGPSGSGKSTLVNLLLRFWQVRPGEIMLNGHELGSYDPEDVRACIGVVSQTTHLFNASLRDNLLLANPDASESQVIQAAKCAQLHDFIQGLPQGYDTWIGEQGVRLSGGERQRLAVARALLRDAPLLILDEATANLDAITERELLQAILHLTRDRTTLVITHRLVAMEWMDEILVLDAGRVKERGTHTELFRDGGLYRHMWDLQNQILEELVSE
jgi:ATP-binding cassette subfamily C protein CydC